MGPQFRDILEDEAFLGSLTDIERTYWENFKWVRANFLCRKKSLISVMVPGNFWMRIRKWDVACNSKFTFCFYIYISFHETLIKSVTNKLNTFVKILCQWILLSSFLERLNKARLLLDVVPWCYRHSVLQKEKVITVLTFPFSRINYVVYAKLYFMPWKCVYVSDLLQFLWIVDLKLSCKNYMCY